MARRPMKTCGLRTLSQRVSWARRSDSFNAAVAASVSRSRRNRPPGRKISSTESSGVAMKRVLQQAAQGTLADYGGQAAATQGAKKKEKSFRQDLVTGATTFL